MAETTRHHRGQVPGARGDVVVHHQPFHAVALDGDAPVALLLDEPPDQLVAQAEQGLVAVGRLAEGEQPRPGGQQP
ncbi:hypothetical protein [Nonomuraea salmonea]|uniref:hypothetical protein n=1 Tax=Nonomuraea salmonea TaxID=46181 RepID=UPI0031E87D59